MTTWLKVSRLIDAFNGRVGQVAYWLILLMALISASNAVIRKLFNLSSNAFLEIQWYLFAAVFLLNAGHTLLRNQHVRVDIVFGALSSRARLWIDILGTILFLFPFALIVLYYSWPYFLASFNVRESSINAGGLSVWPVKLLIPLGFLLLLLQGMSQLIKLFAALRGEVSDDALIEHLSGPQEEVKAVLGDRIL